MTDPDEPTEMGVAFQRAERLRAEADAAARPAVDPYARSADEHPVPTTDDEWHREQDARLRRMRALSPDKTTPHPPTPEQITELRRIITDDAPHTDQCTEWTDASDLADCVCWKSEALALIQNGADR